MHRSLSHPQNNRKHYSNTLNQESAVESRKPAQALGYSKATFAGALVTLAAFLAPQNVSAVGFSLLNIDDKGQAPLQVGLWYPSETEAPKQPNTPFGQALAKDAPIEGKDLKLIVLSHGFGGWLGGHADTALAFADAGFVVAAPSHTGNTFRDMSSPVEKWAIDRPHHISLTIDYLQQEWQQRTTLSNSKVGVYGFSAGGLTAMSLVGAVPNMALAKQHCEQTPAEFGCKEKTLVPAMLAANMQSLPSGAWGADQRIGAAAVAAPGLAFAYDEAALSQVNTPVQLWSALDDQRVPHNYNALPLANYLGERVETHWVNKANHFAFLIQPCTEKLKKYEPDTWDLICTDQEGFNRRDFHQHMNAEMVRFFKEQL